MPQKTLNRFHIDRLGILDESGHADPKLVPHLSPLQLKTLFKNMIYAREFDQRAIALQRQGRMGTYAAQSGQEAISIGAAAAMSPQDWAVPCFREQGLYLARGIKASTLFLFFMGSEEGNRLPRERHTLPYCVPCATQLLHAVGIAMAAKYKKDSVSVVTFFGDGASSEGDFHEALNFASVYQAPVVFICQNNHWAISTPLHRQSHSQSLAQKALAYDMPGLQVDGNDALAVYHATRQALQVSRQGKGPTLLECVSYRMIPHTTSDDPSRYQDPNEVLEWRKKDPIDRFEKYLLQERVIVPGERETLQQSLAEQLKAEAEEAEEICQRLNPEQIFTYMYHHMPEILKPQLEEVLQLASDKDHEGVAHA